MPVALFQRPAEAWRFNFTEGGVDTRLLLISTAVGGNTESGTNLLHAGDTQRPQPLD